jgi:hypothetical protein
LRATSSAVYDCTHFANLNILKIQGSFDGATVGISGWQERITFRLELRTGRAEWPVEKKFVPICPVARRLPFAPDSISIQTQPLERHGPGSSMLGSKQPPRASTKPKLSVIINRVLIIFLAPLAQLDRASGYEPEGREFESLRAHHLLKDLRLIRSSAASSV